MVGEAGVIVTESTTGAVLLTPAVSGGPAVHVAPFVSVPLGAPATLEAVVVPVPSLRP